MQYNLYHAAFLKRLRNVILLHWHNNLIAHESLFTLNMGFSIFALENGKFYALHLEEEHNTIKWVHAITNEHTTIEMEILNMI